VLYFKLVHNPSERLLELIHLLVELLANLHLKLVVEVLVHIDGLVVFLDFNDHVFDHPLHLFNLGGDGDYIVLHLSMFEDALGAEHLAVILAVELDFLLRMDLAVSDGGDDCDFLSSVGSL